MSIKGTLRSIKLKWIAILWITLVGSQIAAQDLSETWEFGLVALEIQQYDLAALTFERVLLFDKDNEYPEALIKVADCHRKNGNYSLAAKFYDQAYFTASSDSLQNEMILQKVFCLLQAKQHKAALAELYHLPEEGIEAFLIRKNFYLGIAAFGSEKFEDSEKYFQNWLEGNGRTDTAALATLYDENEKISRFNPQTAKIMSAIFPGSGQIYAGDWRNGLNSLAITGALYYLFYVTAVDHTFYESLLVIFPWFQRYYKGGRDSAFRIAARKKAERRAAKYREILQHLQWGTP